MVWFIIRSRVDTDDGVKMVGHHAVFIAIGLRVTHEHPLPGTSDLPPQLVQFAPVICNHTKNRLILRHLKCDEEPSVGVIDVMVAEWVGHGVLSFVTS